MTPDAQGQQLLVALEQFKEHLADGALISIDASRARVRLLPLK